MAPSPKIDVDVDPRVSRVDDGHALPHPAFQDAAVQLLAHPGQLDAVVDALGLPHILGDQRADGTVEVVGVAEDVGEVLLALGVVGAQVGQAVAQDCGVEDVDAGVDLADQELFVGGVPVLDDSGDLSACANDSPIT